MPDAEYSDGLAFQITPAQAILAWHVHVGAPPIPKSKSIERQRDNLDIFDVVLTNENFESIGTLSRHDGRLADQYPSVYQEFSRTIRCVYPRRKAGAVRPRDVTFERTRALTFN